MIDYPALRDEIRLVINRHSAENTSNTPDFILAEYLINCLIAWNNNVIWRENWYGRKPLTCDRSLMHTSYPVLHCTCSDTIPNAKMTCPVGLKIGNHLIGLTIYLGPDGECKCG